MKKLMMVLCVFMVLPTFAQQQLIIHGIVRDSDGQPMPYINVLLQQVDTAITLAFSTTDINGQYSLKHTNDQDNVRVTIVGFGIKKQSKVVAACNQQLDFEAVLETINIREVIVKAKPITRRGDTLSYVVGSFIDSVDRTIGDVLKKMPGIEVAQSGQISYNGKAINKFYIEGMDMLEGRYGIAINNVNARDVASVQVLENHQPIKALQKVQFSDRATINLKLKDSAKGTFSLGTELGVGYQPLLWSGELTAMNFSKKFQMISTYKGNNTGDDVSRELTSFYNADADGGSFGSTMMNVHHPYTPTMSEKRYLDNNTHTGSINTVSKLGNDYRLSVNGIFVNDVQQFKGQSLTSYYLPTNELLTIDERAFALRNINRAEINTQLEANTDSYYLKDRFSVKGDWSSRYGDIITSGDSIRQWLDIPSFDIRNEASYICNFDDFRLNLYSINSYTSSPASMEVKPMLYPFMFNAADVGMIQRLNTRNFNSLTQASFSFTHGLFTHEYRAGFQAELNWLNSALRPSSYGLTADSMSNDSYERRLTTFVAPVFSYNNTGRFNISLAVPINWLFLDIEDRVSNKKQTINRLIVEPILNATVTLTPMLKLSMIAMYQNNIGGLYDAYSGYIMTDYRMIGTRSGILSDNDYQNYSISIGYGNAIHALFISANASYWHLNSNVMYSTRYIGSLSHIRIVDMPNVSQGFRVEGKISKRFDAIASTFTLNGSYNKSFTPLLRQNRVMSTTADQINVGLNVDVRFARIATLSYNVQWFETLSKIFGRNSSDVFRPIDVISQSLKLNLLPSKKFRIMVGGEHIYNSGIESGSRSIFFLDASATYKTKHIELTLDGRNLLDTRSFSSASYSNATSYSYNYTLRPASVMVRARFKIL